jgi:cell division protein FtsN
MTRRRYNEPPLSYPPPWLWLTAGGLIGFTLAFLLFSSRLFPANSAPAAPVVAAAPEQPQAPAAATPVAPEPDKTAGKEAEKNAGKDKHKTSEKEKPAAPRFEFYDVLSSDGQPQPPSTPPPGSPANNPAETAPGQPPAVPAAPLVAADSVPPAGSLILQLASFQKQEDANAFAQRLSQLGFQPSIQRATINGADWFRVRLGPYSSQEQLSHQRELLRQHKIAEGMVLKF